jgi:deazaflavin-dependent oxidoreductase (nitroreductase family)
MASPAPAGQDDAMPLPQRLARFNKVATNRVARVVAGRLPGFGIIIHRGRKSGRVFRTPVNVYARSGGFTVALTYGGGDWVANVLAAGTAEIRTKGRTFRVGNPRVVKDPTRGAVPRPVRVILGWLHVDEFLHVDSGEATGTT